MRTELHQMQGQRQSFIGEFVRIGHKRGWGGIPAKTILLKNIRTGISLITDHLWFNYTEGFKALGELKEGDIIQFEARSKSYEKGYAGWNAVLQAENYIEKDYKLSNPSKIKKIQ